jgi:hypothetical protein
MWKEAIARELAALKVAGMWKIVERPLNRNVVDSKWVFRVKKPLAGRLRSGKLGWSHADLRRSTGSITSRHLLQWQG